jgi:LacI family transcriptional regulator, galactose operon repressor
MVTIKDVAREAGVSVASVSRALNGTGEVTEKVRRRVQAAAAKLKYVPHRAAQMLITKRTHTIGLLLPDLHGEFFSELLRGIDDSARGRGLHLLVSNSHGNAHEATLALKSMVGRVDGFLILSPHVDSRFLRAVLPKSIPAVLMNTHDASGVLASVSVDNYGGAFSMMRHLVGRGCKRILHIAGPEGNFDAAERLRGYRDALAQLLPSEREWVLRGDFTEESGYRAAREMLSLGQMPDAIFAGNDTMAIGCLYALTEADVQVPGQVLLAGFDDIPIARFVTPPLTTVRVEIAELGTRALDRLAVAIDGATRTTRSSSESLLTDLVVRSSCGARNVVHLADRRVSSAPSRRRLRRS